MDGAEKRGVGSHQDDVPTLCPSSQRQRDHEACAKDELERAGQRFDSKIGAGHGTAERYARLKRGEEGESPLIYMPDFHAIGP